MNDFLKSVWDSDYTYFEVPMPREIEEEFYEVYIQFLYSKGYKRWK